MGIALERIDAEGPAWARVCQSLLPARPCVRAAVKSPFRRRYGPGGPAEQKMGSMNICAQGDLRSTRSRRFATGSATTCHRTLLRRLQLPWDLVFALFSRLYCMRSWQELAQTVARSRSTVLHTQEKRGSRSASCKEVRSHISGERDAARRASGGGPTDAGVHKRKQYHKAVHQMQTHCARDARALPTSPRNATFAL